eukprot:GHVR01003530.1.p1 GENE.GHVR01003530.1~~GHVR01003530.1.p1  ORF type:complete len:116 (+),score=8.08 GHVR01003530.1:1176-1523(+)
MIENLSIQGKRSALLFLFQMTFNYDIKSVLANINLIIPHYFETILMNSKDILQTMQIKRNKRKMFGSLCNAIATGCFNPEIEGTIINLLVDNTTCRFNFSHIDEAIKDMETKQKK